MVRFFRKNILSINHLCTEKDFEAALLGMEKKPAGELILYIILSI